MTRFLRRTVLAMFPPVFREHIKRRLRNTGTWAFRTAVRAAQMTGLLSRPQAENSMLVIYLSSHFGDAVMLLPMLEAIHHANPGTPLDVACARGADDLFTAVPFLRHVYVAPVPSAPPSSLLASLRRRWELLRWYLRDLRDLRPRLALMPRWGDDLFASQYLAFMLGTPTRAGYMSTVDPLQRPAPQRDHLLTLPIRGGNHLHEPLRFLHAACEAGLVPPSASWRTDLVSRTLLAMSDNVSWPALRTRLHLPEAKPLAVLAPGASLPNKTWPAPAWRALAQALGERGFAVVLLSGRADRAVAEQIAASLPERDIYLVAASTSIPESIALMSHSELFIGNDSGPGHAAGALGIPTVTLFASARDIQGDHTLSAARIRPMGPYVTTLHPSMQDGCVDACIRSHTHCIAGIRTEEVLQAALALHARKANDAVAQPFNAKAYA